MRSAVLGAIFAAAVAAAPAAQAQTTDVAIGLSGWTGFGPLTLAAETGLFKKHGVNVALKKIPQASRNLALASGDIQCAATTVETWLVWNAHGVPATQIFQLDVSHGADGMAVRKDVGSIEDLKGKTVAASAPGTSPYLLLAWMLDKNGLSTDDVRVVNLEPGPAAQAFVAGQNDAAMTYEPYLSTIRDNEDAGKIIATTDDYPAVMDTLGCTPSFLEEHPDAAKGIADGYYDALKMIDEEPEKAYEIMGADVNQTASEFKQSAQYLQWQDRASATEFFDKTYPEFANEAATLLVKMGLIEEEPDVNTLADSSYIQQ